MTDIVSRTLSIHQEHELLGALERAGLSREDAQSLIQSPSGRLAKSVVNHIRWGGVMDFPPPTESQRMTQLRAKLEEIEAAIDDGQIRGRPTHDLFLEVHERQAMARIRRLVNEARSCLQDEP